MNTIDFLFQRVVLRAIKEARGYNRDPLNLDQAYNRCCTEIHELARACTERPQELALETACSRLVALAVEAQRAATSICAAQLSLLAAKQAREAKADLTE